MCETEFCETEFDSDGSHKKKLHYEFRIKIIPNKLMSQTTNTTSYRNQHVDTRFVATVAEQ
jgi:hypothetical protein